MKNSIPFEFEAKSMQTGTKIKICQWREGHQILKGRKKSKKAGQFESQLSIQVWKLKTWVEMFDIKQIRTEPIRSFNYRHYDFQRQIL